MGWGVRMVVLLAYSWDSLLECNGRKGGGGGEKKQPSPEQAANMPLKINAAQAHTGAA